MGVVGMTRRAVLGGVATAAFGAVAVAAAAGGSLPAFAEGKLKVAGIYTVPIEQQWVSRIHVALKAAADRGDIEYVWAESVANTDYERVMRQYAEAGQQLVFGEVFGVERAARAVAKDYRL
ncbi:hypothetical protein [Azospirillum sp. B506]|uniref:hypothetical protein n=1 Tax=Azospirillum sp. B506 TaxID=137721 RepID=UPI00034A2E78|nr:hypothetical protein [Azospirillum sp. B506]